MVNAVLQQKVPKLFNLGPFLETFLSQLVIKPKKSPSIKKDFSFYNL